MSNFLCLACRNERFGMGFFNKYKQNLYHNVSLLFHSVLLFGSNVLKTHKKKKRNHFQLYNIKHIKWLYFVYSNGMLKYLEKSLPYPMSCILLEFLQQTSFHFSKAQYINVYPNIWCFFFFFLLYIFCRFHSVPFSISFILFF